jgi:hypothetical protein
MYEQPCYTCQQLQAVQSIITDNLDNKVKNQLHARPAKHVTDIVILLMLHTFSAFTTDCRRALRRAALHGAARGAETPKWRAGRPRRAPRRLAAKPLAAGVCARCIFIVCMIAICCVLLKLRLIAL